MCVQTNTSRFHYVYGTIAAVTETKRFVFPNRPVRTYEFDRSYVRRRLMTLETHDACYHRFVCYGHRSACRTRRIHVGHNVTPRSTWGLVYFAKDVKDRLRIVLQSSIIEYYIE
jgi:hypothetical protein